MKLSTLVAYLNQIDEALPLQGQTAVHKSIAPMLHLVQTNSVQFADNTTDVVEKFNGVRQALAQFDQSILDLRKQLKQEIENHETQYFARSYQLYDEEMRHDSPELILNRRFNLSPEAHEIVSGCINAYNDWKHAGLIIRPGLEDWVDSLVGLDPLYLVDDSWEMFEPVKKKFNDLYRSRLCFYTIKEREEAPILQYIPQGQFRFCLVYNFFNYKPLEVIKRYLTEIYEKLKPGGVLAFTFNDCDRAAGVELAERCFMCFTPKSMIVALAEHLGYEVHKSLAIDAATHWMELRKPGELHSVRGGQSLAKVFDKDPKPQVDIPVQMQYNKIYSEEERQQLLLEAVRWGIASTFEEAENQNLDELELALASAISFKKDRQQLLIEAVKWGVVSTIEEAEDQDLDALKSLINIKKSWVFRPRITR